MNRDNIIRMAQEAGLWPAVTDTFPNELERFAALVAAAEREKVARWQIGSGYTTGHGETIEDLLVELEWQVRESEREACAKVCEEIAAWYSTDIFPEDGTSIDCNSAKMGRVVTKNCAAQIRARGRDV